MHLRSNEIAVRENVKEVCIAWKSLDYRELRYLASAFDEYDYTIIGYRVRQVADDIEFAIEQGESGEAVRDYAKPAWRALNRDIDLFLN